MVDGNVNGSHCPSCPQRNDIGPAGALRRRGELFSYGVLLHLTRRDFLRWASLVAATPLLVQLEQRPARATGGVVAINLELVTLTETSVILTWFTGDPTQVDSMGRLAPVPADTEVLIGTSSGAIR